MLENINNKFKSLFKFRLPLFRILSSFTIHSVSIFTVFCIQVLVIQISVIQAGPDDTHKENDTQVLNSHCLLEMTLIFQINLYADNDAGSVK